LFLAVDGLVFGSFGRKVSLSQAASMGLIFSGVFESLQENILSLWTAADPGSRLRLELYQAACGLGITQDLDRRSPKTPGQEAVYSVLPLGFAGQGGIASAKGRLLYLTLVFLPALLFVLLRRGPWAEYLPAFVHSGQFAAVSAAVLAAAVLLLSLNMILSTCLIITSRSLILHRTLFRLIPIYTRRYPLDRAAVFGNIAGCTCLFRAGQANLDQKLMVSLNLHFFGIQYSELKLFLRAGYAILLGQWLEALAKDSPLKFYIDTLDYQEPQESRPANILRLQHIFRTQGLWDFYQALSDVPEEQLLSPGLASPDGSEGLSNVYLIMDYLHYKYSDKEYKSKNFYDQILDMSERLICVLDLDNEGPARKCKLFVTDRKFILLTKNYKIMRCYDLNTDALAFTDQKNCIQLAGPDHFNYYIQKESALLPLGALFQFLNIPLKHRFAAGCRD
jgi:hypothetical protein